MKAYRSATIWLSVLLLLALAIGCSRGRSDAQIVSEVQNRINTDFAVPNKQITVTSNNGVVTLSGQVGNDMERAAAANDAAQVQGVRTVVNNLQVSPTAAGMLNQPEPMPAPAVEPAPPRRSPAAHTSSRPAPAYSAPAPSSNAAPAAAAVPAVPAAPPAPRPVTIPDGTTLSIRLRDSIDSDRNQAGDTFRATLDAPVVLGDQVVIPANADVQGRVVELASAGKFKGRSEIALELSSISFNGKSYSIRTNQYSKQGSSRGKRTAATIGGGAALGAIIGGIAGGGKGAAIGAAAGAGAGTGVQAITKGEQIRLKPETVLSFRLENPVTVTPSSINRRTAQYTEPVSDTTDYSDTSSPNTSTTTSSDDNAPVLKRRPK